MLKRNDLIFREVQRFSLWFRLPFALCIPLLVWIAVCPEKMVGVEPDSLASTWFVWVVVFLIVVSIVISIIFIITKLETEVRPEGLYVRFFPIHTQYRKFTADSLSEYYVCKYRPVLEYGGWGIRYSSKGKAYNMSGNKGVQLILKSGKRLLIGSKRPQELAEAINAFMSDT